MSRYYGQVFEDPEYYDDEEPIVDDIEEFEDPSDWISALEVYSPHNTVNS